MKKYLISVFAVMMLLLLFDYFYYQTGALYLPHTGEASYHAKAEGEQLYLDQGDGFEVFDLKGVNLGLGKPGYFATEHSITKEEYLRWFKQIQELGANVIRTYTLAGEEFYDAFYEYNQNNDTPLYLLHGVWVDDYLINASYGAWEEEFYQPFLDDCKAVVDVIHGRHKCKTENSIFPAVYNRDISPWVYGYIPGIEWEGTLVSYTDYSFPQREQLEGTYFYTEDASNFEIFLASIGEEMVSYETRKYGTQRVIAFSNWPTTDPLAHDPMITVKFTKAGKVDVEHIKCTDAFPSGQFASYHIYPYYPDYYSLLDGHEENTYLHYLTDINEHHSVPVVISEFGIPSSRGMADQEKTLGRNQGGMSETEQGEALVSLYHDIKQAGSAGGIVFIWQDEWFKRSWNTIARTDLLWSPYWSDYQTNEQAFGLLSFDPGEEQSICYVNGERSDWTADDLVTEQDGVRLSMKYDEKFIYFLVEQEGFDLEQDKLYIPIDTTPKSGATYAEELDLSMSEASDFVIEIDGIDNSRLWVQERYDILNALYYERISPENIFSRTFPETDSTDFDTVHMLLRKYKYYEKVESGEDLLLTFAQYDETNRQQYRVEESYETGKLTYGNADPAAADFNSLADFCAGDGFVEIKLPWSLLNFANPANMTIHDDYYEHYGVEYLSIDSLRVGTGNGDNMIQMKSFPLKKLGKEPKYHERLKESYYILQSAWTE